MYKVIMVPTHGEETERPALSVAVSLALKLKAELRLVQVESDSMMLAAETAGFVETEELSLAERSSRQKKLSALAASLGVPFVISTPRTQWLSRLDCARGICSYLESH